MKPSLLELQRRFAALLRADTGDPAARIGIYRNTVVANYRNALAASYPVVRALTGAAFFATLVDAYVGAHPSTGGDLNVYGGMLGAFIASYPHGRDVPYLADVARLEWAIDEAYRAADSVVTAAGLAQTLAAIPLEDALTARLVLHASCRMLQSPYPVLRIWQAHHEASAAYEAIDFAAGDDRLLIRREEGTVVMERLAPGDFAWLSALTTTADLGGTLEMALAADTAFDLRATLSTMIANGTLANVVVSHAGST